jgi:cystathionine beta-lyase
MSRFDELIERRGTKSYKWDTMESKYDRNDLTAMWVADADFKVAKPILDVLVERVNHGIFGYTKRPDEFYDSIINWCEKRHNWKIEKEWISYTPGVVAAINWAVKVYTEPGDKIIVQPPVYFPFFSAVENKGRVLINNNLIIKDGKYYMDFDNLISQIDERTKLLILCSPHNPISRVWSKEELVKLTDICVEHNIKIISDEIHSDLIMPGYKHTCTSSISDKVAQLTITCMAPSKSFNIAGLDTAVAIIPNNEMRKKFTDFQNEIGVNMGNVFGIEAFIAAYNSGEEWLENEIVYINDNFKYFKNFIETKIPQFKVTELEGTYLLWLNCSCLNMTKEELDKFFVEKVKVMLVPGENFGNGGKGFMRFNIATPRENIVRVLENLENAVK